MGTEYGRKVVLPLSPDVWRFLRRALIIVAPVERAIYVNSCYFLKVSFESHVGPIVCRCGFLPVLSWCYSLHSTSSCSPKDRTSFGVDAFGPKSMCKRRPQMMSYRCLCA